MVRTRVGYAGGATPAPTYPAMGDHTECLQVDFDPRVLAYADLLEHFWRAHSPWHPGRGVQYRSVLLVQGEAQRAAARASLQRLERRVGRRVLTPIEDLGTFTRAEDYHQKYCLRRHREVARELLGRYGEGDAFTDSTVATRLNAYLAGHGSPAQRAQELPEMGLGPGAARLVRQVTERALR